MSRYAGTCQDLGFLCEWQATAESSQAVVSSLVDHLNNAHGTGSNSPALSALIARHITEIPIGAGQPTHVQEHAL